MRNGWLSFIGLGLISFPVWGATCADWESRWNSKYRADFHVNWTSERFQCNDDGLVAEAILSSGGHRYRPNQQGFVPDFYGDLTRPLAQLAWNPKCTYIAQTSRSAGRITICPVFLRQTVENRASSLVHEGRHLEAGDPGHVTCNGGPYDGKAGSCDLGFYDGSWQGSGYNADIYYMAWAKRNGTQLNGLRQEVLEGRDSRSGSRPIQQYYGGPDHRVAE